LTKKLSALLLLALWLSACAPSPASAPTASTETAAPVESAPEATSEQAGAAREAILSEFENEVIVRADSEGEYVPAEAGFLIQAGGALQTGANGRARLDLNPEGTIVRVAPNSAFTIPELSSENGQPKSSISLFFGKIFVLLNGGSLDVQTPSGVASVRGSLLSVSFNPSTGQIFAACLEGHCALINNNGAEVELEEGESAKADQDGEISEFEEIDQDEALEWLDEVPELNEFLEELPDLEDFPEIEGFETYDFDPSEVFGESNAEDSEGFFDLDEESLPGVEDFTDGDEEPGLPGDDPGEGTGGESDGDDGGGGDP
jgi:hypothetical protein